MRLNVTTGTTTRRNWVESDFDYWYHPRPCPCCDPVCPFCGRPFRRRGYPIWYSNRTVLKQKNSAGFSSSCPDCEN